MVSTLSPLRRLPVLDTEPAPAAQLTTPPQCGRLVDGFGRTIRNLRVSITDRCNFRCTYCMPADGLDWLPKTQILTYEEIHRLVQLFVRLGIEEIRLTGGEPTVRKDLPALIGLLAPLHAAGMKSLSITTNGILLDKLAGPLAEAGLTRINVSLDTLDPDKFHQITRRRALDQVMAGLEALERYPSVRPIKVNVVAIRGFTTEEDVLALAELARRKPYAVRFIEYMPLDADGNWQSDLVMSGEELRKIIDRKWPMDRVAGIDPSSTSVVYRFADGRGEMGFINPVTEPFCATCDRIRLTADGQLRTCLFSIDETDLKTPLRDGASDAEVERIVRAAVWQKEKKHKINEGDAFQRASRSMSQIGG